MIIRPRWLLTVLLEVNSRVSSYALFFFPLVSAGVVMMLQSESRQ